MPMQNREIFKVVKYENFQNFFLIFAQNIDCGCTLEPPRPKIGIPQFYYIKVGYKGVFISRTCFPDALKAPLPYF